MKKLILIRHAETSYTAERRYCGHSNTPLNAKGRIQARRLRCRLIGESISIVYSSPLRRAAQTAKIVFPDKPILKRKALREIDFGKFSGHTFRETTRLFPDAYKKWVENPLEAKMPGGESVKFFKKRVENCFAKILKENPDKPIAVVSHGGPLHIILLKILGLGFDKFWELNIDTAEVIEVNNGRVYFHSRRRKKRQKPFRAGTR